MFVGSNYSSVKNIIGDKASRDSIFADWDIWKNQEVPGENERRDIAVELMKEAYNFGIKDLNLSNLNLTSIPNHISIDLISLNVSKNKISELTDIELSTLKILDISSNKLTKLTNRFPEDLIYLNLRNNLISSFDCKLPDSLRKLDISCNELNAIVNDFPVNLEVLDISYNKLTNLIENIPRNLMSLYANDNKIHNIECELPLSLDAINIRNNNITTLASEVYNLRKETFIFLEGNPISKECKNKLNDIRNNPDYIGPDFSFDS